VGKVKHFSWWNCDYPQQTCRIRGRVVDCNGKPISGATIVVNGQYSLITNANGIYERTAPRMPLRFEVRLLGVTQTLANTVSLNNPTTGLNTLPDIRVGAVGNCPTSVTGTISRCGSDKRFSIRVMWGQSTEGWVPTQILGDSFRLVVTPGKPLIIRLSSGTFTKDTLIGSLTNGQTLNINQLSGCVTRPAVRTTTVSNIAATSATSGGEILSNGGAPIIAKGVCWSTSPNANARNANQRTSSGTGTATFTSNLAGLQSNTRYYYRAYAVNNVDTAYGNELNFTTSAASITTLNCAGAVNTGTLTRGVAASGVSSSVPYTGGNGGTYAAFTVQSTGVTGLTASTAAGSFVSANGNLTVTITGTPANGGTASFALNIGGRTCTLTRTVSLPPGTITGLNCAGAVNSGSLNIGNVASGVSSSVPYTGGNGGTYAAFTVQSTGVAGLTASIAAGTFVSGNGNLVVVITGTPTTSGTASFSINIGGKSCILTRIIGTTQHTCGAINVHNPSLTYGTMTDQEGNTYKTIQIGTQVWMAENLKTTKYRNGTPISIITDNTQWANNTTGAFCSYNNSTINDCPYGKLYNWYAVNNTNQLCPTGWHVPTDAEWTTLTDFLGGSLRGGKMKSTGTQYWSSPNDGATNSSGWSGLPGGGRNSGAFSSIGTNGGWWSSTEVSTSTVDVWMRGLSYSYEELDRGISGKWVGGSVRCLRD
jgi:uncharacterized protein (TIGR02145 family)